MFTYTKMLNDSEIVILRATGMSPLKIGRPALMLSTLVMLLGYLNTTYLMPTSFREFKDLQREFRSELSSLFLQEGVFNPVVEGITVFIRERSKDGQLYGIIIHDERKPEKPVTMMAEQGAIVSSDTGPRVLMVNGNRQEVRQDDGRLSLLYFDRYTFDLSALNKTEINLWREPEERFLHELLFSSDQAETIYNYRLLRMEGLYRLSSPLLYLAFTAIGLALLLGGDFNRRGQFLRILIAVCCVTVVQIIVLSIKNLGEKDSGARIHYVSSSAAHRRCLPCYPHVRSTKRWPAKITPQKHGPKRTYDMRLSRTFSSYVGRQFLLSFLAFTVGLLSIIMVFETLELFRRVSSRAEVAGLEHRDHDGAAETPDHGRKTHPLFGVARRDVRVLAA